jgi:HEPN domain-containing protein
MNEWEKVNYWIEIALDDFESAEIMLKNRKFLQSGFYCHQVIEKILKGYYFYKTGGEPPYTHNVVRLADESGIAALFSEDQKALLDLLMPLNIEARYPDERKELMTTLTHEKTGKIFTETGELFNWIRLLMKK